jgi:hypothetical protein
VASLKMSQTTNEEVRELLGQKPSSCRLDGVSPHLLVETYGQASFAPAQIFHIALTPHAALATMESGRTDPSLVLTIDVV